MKKYNRDHCSKVEQIEDRISELDDRNFEITQLEAKREKRIQKYKKGKKPYVLFGIHRKDQCLEQLGFQEEKRERKKQFI